MSTMSQWPLRDYQKVRSRFYFFKLSGEVFTTYVEMNENDCDCENRRRKSGEEERHTQRETEQRGRKHD